MRRTTSTTDAAAPQHNKQHAGHRLSRTKKLTFAVATVVIFFAIVELLLGLCGVQPAAMTDDPFVGFSSYAPLFLEESRPDGSTQMSTSPGKLTWFNAQQFERPKADGVYRIFCLGGSTTYGRPYDDRTSFCGWLREMLADADPDGRYEVINAGGISYASYRVARLMEELVAYEPDLFIIYTGHNEFLERRTYAEMFETPAAVRWSESLLARTRTYGVLRRVMHGERRPRSEDNVLSTEVLAQLDSVVGLEAYHRDPEFRHQVLAHFEFNLSRMIEIAHDSSADVILVTPASNLANCSPFKSEFSATHSIEDIERFHADLDQSREEYDREQFEAALAAVEHALQIDAYHAEALYWRGRILLALGRIDDARESLLRSRDEDVCPLRALSEIETLVRDAAKQHDVPLVDFASIAAAQSPTRIPGNELFLDHVHPTIDGHGILARFLMDELVGQGVVARRPGWNQDGPAAVAERIHASIDEADRAAALRNLSKVLGWSGKLEESADLALKAVDINPGDAEAQYEAGNALYTRGNLTGALDRFMASLTLDPDSAQTWYGLGLVHADLGTPDQAINDFREAVSRRPEFADAHYNLANMLSNAGDLIGAREHYEIVLRIDARNVYALNNLGIVLVRGGDLDGAQRRFEEAVRIRPDFVDALLNLGRIHETKQDYPAAARCYRDALAIEPEHPVALGSLRRVEEGQ